MRCWLVVLRAMEAIDRAVKEHVTLAAHNLPAPGASYGAIDRPRI